MPLIATVLAISRRIPPVSKQLNIQGFLAQVDRAGTGDCALAGHQHQRSGRHDAIPDLEWAHEALNGDHLPPFLRRPPRAPEDLADIEPERFDDQRIDLSPVDDHSELPVSRTGISWIELPSTMSLAWPPNVPTPSFAISIAPT